MNSNRISATLTQADRDTIMAAIDTINQRLPFLVSLSSEEIQDLPKMGTRRLGFVQESLEVATQNLNIMPRGFDADEMRKESTFRSKILV
ncbi:MAG: hypothetical protein AB1489_31810 [Acidobacteriota bacterium]